jgi:hypothetical protein
MYSDFSNIISGLMRSVKPYAPCHSAKAATRRAAADLAREGMASIRAMEIVYSAGAGAGV